MKSTVTCPGCGTEFPAGGAPNSPKVYCSDRCKWRVKGQAKSRRQGRRTQKDRRENPRQCSVPACEEKHAARDFCRNHYRQWQVEQGNESYAWGARNERKRAELWGVEYEPVNRAELFAADGWTCQLCDDPVDPELSWPHPLSASLDHKKPMSKGGPHLRWNCQLAHLACNVKKAAR